MDTDTRTSALAWPPGSQRSCQRTKKTQRHPAGTHQRPGTSQLHGAQAGANSGVGLQHARAQMLVVMYLMMSSAGVPTYVR